MRIHALAAPENRAMQHLSNVERHCGRTPAEALLRRRAGSPIKPCRYKEGLSRSLWTGCKVSRFRIQTLARGGGVSGAALLGNNGPAKRRRPNIPVALQRVQRLSHSRPAVGVRHGAKGCGAAEWPVGLAPNTATWNGMIRAVPHACGAVGASSRKHGSSIYVLICAPGMRFLRMWCSGWASGATLFWPVLRGAWTQGQSTRTGRLSLSTSKWQSEEGNQSAAILVIPQSHTRK